VLVRGRAGASAPAGSRIFRRSISGIAAAIFTGLTVAWRRLGLADRSRDDLRQYGIGYFTWEAYSLVQYADIALG